MCNFAPKSENIPDFINKIMKIECPFCHLENAYHDGVSYVCPDCDGTWGGDDDDDDEF